MPTEINPDAIQVVVYGSATMGALTAVILIVNWLRKLFLLDGQRVIMLTSGVALYVAITIFTAAVLPWAGIALSIVIFTALLASGADAIVSQGKTASSDGIAALKSHTEATQTTDEHPLSDQNLPLRGIEHDQAVYRSKGYVDIAERQS